MPSSASPLAFCSPTPLRRVTGISVSCDYWVRTDAPAVNPSAIAISGDASHMAVTEHGVDSISAAVFMTQGTIVGTNTMKQIREHGFLGIDLRSLK